MAFDREVQNLKTISGTSLPLLSFVMSGGSGSRLWPLSRLDKPKQFHRLAGETSLLTATLNRLNASHGLSGKTCVIGAEAHHALIKDAIAEQNDSHTSVQMILEPVARNTAAVAALAVASALLHDYGDGLILLCPADHEITTTEQFWQTVTQGIPAALQGSIVTFGLLPERPETGYGYIEAGQASSGGYAITRFVEKPEHETALAYIRQGNFFWNSGIFLFRASVMRDAFMAHAPDIWSAASTSLQNAERNEDVISLPQELYSQANSVSFDYAIMEKVNNCVLIPAAFRWSDLGSWQSLLKLQQETSAQDICGNVLVGDVIAHDCRNSYLRSETGLLTVSGLSDMAIIATKDATFIAPIAQSQHVQAIVSRLTTARRQELFYEKPHQNSPNHRERVQNWLFEKALPHWATSGVNHHHGGFYEKLSLQGLPVAGPRRSRTMARQIYAFAQGGLAGWTGSSSNLIAHGLLFMQANGRSQKGGWVQSFDADGTVAQAQENLYDQTCMLLALAYAYKAGHNQALQLADETFAFIHAELAHPKGGFFETSSDRNNPDAELTSNAHMHLLEACLAWHEFSGDDTYLRRARAIVHLCKRVFFDQDYWSLGEFFNARWQRASGARGAHTEPGHYFEWAALLSDYAQRTGDESLRMIAYRLYSCALSAGTNRSTGLAYNVVSREGRVIDNGSRSWQQCEALKATIWLNGYNGLDLKPEIEARVENLFRWHLHPAKAGLWHDRLDATGAVCSDHVPASILYHLVSALTLYLKYAEKTAATVLRPVVRVGIAEREFLPA